MKRLIVFVAATALLAFVVAGPAGAAKSKSPTLAQFKALSKKVTTLQKQEKQIENALNFLAAYDVCLTAATADALQGTWIFTNKATPTPIFPGTSTGTGSINDLQACSAFKIPRQLPSTETAPTTAVFSALTNIFS